MSHATIRLAAFAIFGCVLAAAGDSVYAYTCYTLLDRNDNVVYRDTIPPVDLSDQGTASRNVLQQRGEYLMISEADRCPQVAFVFGVAGSPNLSTDEFLNGIRPTGSTRAAGSTAPGSRGTSAVGSPPATPSSGGASSGYAK